MADERWVDDAPAGAEGWRAVWRDDRRYRPRKSAHEWLLGILRRFFRRAAAPDAERQRDFNLSLLDLLGDLRGDVAAVRDDYRQDLETLSRDLGEAIGVESAKLRELVLIAA